MYPWTGVCVCVCIDRYWMICVCAYMHTCIHAYMHYMHYNTCITCIHAFIHPSINPYIYIYIHRYSRTVHCVQYSIYSVVYIYTWIYIYRHIHIIYMFPHIFLLAFIYSILLSYPSYSKPIVSGTSKPLSSALGCWSSVDFTVPWSNPTAAGGGLHGWCTRPGKPTVCELEHGHRNSGFSQ